MIALFILLGMVTMHYLADWVLQTDVVAKYKQKSNWEDLIAKDSMYKDDYKSVLEIHCIFWSICINIPIIIAELYTKGYEASNNNIKFFAFISSSVILNLFIHYIVDDLKANKNAISLSTDQFIHYIQMIISLAVYFIFIY